jgi:3-polyprenyl-4-hydroxybenzoate decarboxylase
MVIEAAATARAARATPAASGDIDRFRLRRFIDDLAGELERREAPVDLADVAQILDGNPRVVLLAAGPERQELVGNVMGAKSRLARAFGVQPERLAAEVTRRLAGKPQLIELAREAAPVQQAIETGAAADLTALPVHLQHGLDGAPYISAGIDYVLDSKTGWTNVGIRRLMLRGRREAWIDLVAPSDLRALYEASAAEGRPLPVSFVVGATAARLEARVPEPPRFEGRRFASVEAALADGPKYFAELMAATGSRDGREIVRELETLRSRTALDRDEEGRYFVKVAAKG